MERRRGTARGEQRGGLHDISGHGAERVLPVQILDPRLRSRAYGRAFLEALPACRLVDDRGAVAAFFGERVAASA